MKKQLITVFMVSLIAFSLHTQALPKQAKALIEALDLSQEQQQAFKQLHDGSKPNKQMRHKEHKAMQEKQKLLFEDYSAEKAESLAQEIADKARERALKRFEHMHQILQILDDEQKKQFLQLMAKKKHPHHESRGH